MANIRIPFLVGKKNADGSTRWYWQPDKVARAAGFRSASLGKDEGMALQRARELNQEYDRWKIHGEAVAAVRPRQLAGTLGALILKYRHDVLNGKKPDGSPVIARSTARTYNTGLLRLEAWAGRHPLAYITRARVKVLRNAMLGPPEKGGVGHHAAHQTLKMGRQLFKFAADCDMIAAGANPFTEFGLASPGPRAVIWSTPAREAMVLAAYEQGQPSIALAIMLGFAIGQREQDLLALVQRQYVAIPEHKMQPEDYATLAAMAHDGIPRGLRVRQLKTNAWIEVPVVGQVRWAVENNIQTARAGSAATILVDDTRSTGAAAAVYSDSAGQTRFQRDFAEIREWAIAAAQFDGDGDLAEELATLQFRDLRRTCVVYLGELGMDAHLIAGVTGHDIDETQRILKTYMPRTTGRAARAIALASVRQAKQNDAAREKSA